jgi:hypothetical protein
MLSSFIQKAQKIHNEKYAYDLVEYKNAKTKIKIVCHTHGIFEQTPDKHLFGQGCPLCSKYRKKSLTEFEEKAIKIHNAKYDYSKTDFSHIKNRAIIICPEHGEFLQILDKHINFGRGCPDCGGSRKKTLEEFIAEAEEVHCGLYDYSLVEYIGFERKITIICKRHGEFYQTPHNHIIGKQGCPHCVHRISKGETDWLNFIGLPNDKLHRNVLLRLDDRKIKADGYDPATATVYEFYGDYYHGNPIFYKSNMINPHTKCSFGELYQRTLEKEASIFKSGLKLVSIWEHEWKAANEAK